MGVDWTDWQKKKIILVLLLRPKIDSSHHRTVDPAKLDLISVTNPNSSLTTESLGIPATA